MSNNFNEEVRKIKTNKENLVVYKQPETNKIQSQMIELSEKFLEIKKTGWVKGEKNNYGSAGITFEKLINNNWTNFEIPDYNDIEIKTKSSPKEKYITLFSAIPDSFLFEIKRIVNQYGYPDKQFPQFNIFNMDIYSYKYKKGNSNYYFKLCVNRKEENIVLNVYDSEFKLIDSNTKWSFDVIKEKLLRKLKVLALIEVDKKYINNEIFFKYKTLDFFILKSFNTFIDLIDKGKIRIVFRIGIYKTPDKFGKIYDHGSAFCIKKDDLEMLFQKVEGIYPGNLES